MSKVHFCYLIMFALLGLALAGPIDLNFGEDASPPAKEQIK